MITDTRRAASILAGNDLARELKSLKFRAFLSAGILSAGTFSLACAGFDIAPFESTQNTVLSSAVTAVIFQKFYSVLSSSKRIRTIRSGAEGEKTIAKGLAGLSGYQVFNHVLLPNKYSRTGHTEADFIVVGKQGVEVVEVKNNAGDILADESAERWRVLSGRRDDTMRNPVKQAAIQAGVLKKLLRPKGIECSVGACVVFSNENARLIGHKGLEMPVIKYRKGKLRRTIKRIDKHHCDSSFDQRLATEAIEAIHAEGQRVEDGRKG
jgi:hypothetical protein